LEAQARQLRDTSTDVVGELPEEQEEVKEEEKEKAIRDTENYLHQSIDHFLNESHGMAPKSFKNRTTKVNKALFDGEDGASNKTQE